MTQIFRKDYKTERTVDGAPRKIAEGVIAVPTETVNRSWEDRLAQRAPDDMLAICRSQVDAIRKKSTA